MTPSECSTTCRGRLRAPRSPSTVLGGTYDDLATACELVNRHGFGALPVLDKGNHLVGILSKADLVRAFAYFLENHHASV